MPLQTKIGYIVVFICFGNYLLLLLLYVVTLEMDPYYEDVNLGGLCGSYNDDRDDDFKSPDGTYLAYAGAFATSWKLEDYVSVVMLILSMV